MALEIIKFEKSPQIRFMEFMDILCGGHVLTRSGIQNQWKHYIEVVIEPVGWQAMWHMSRIQCEDFQITFPTIVFVEVLGVNFCTLLATIKVIGVQDNIDIPETYDVPLQVLYPTLHQENNLLDVEGTANCIDQFRFFYEHVWFPWDNDENDAEDWVNEYLKSRIDLYFDMYSGGCSRDTALHIRSLLDEGRIIQQRLTVLRNDTVSSVSHLLDGDDGLESDVNTHWIELQLRMKRIQIEVEELENPILRNIIIRKKQEVATESRRQCKDGEKEICFVWLGGLIDEYLQALSKARDILGSSSFIKSFHSAHVALEQAIEGDTILLCAGIHKISGVGGLVAGGVIMGMSLPADTLLQERNQQRTLLDTSASGQTFKLQNLTISSSAIEVLLLVRSGTVYLSSCHLEGDKACKTQQGILVLPGAKLVMEDCVFRNLSIAIVVNDGAEVSVNNCTASGCCTGFKILGEPKIYLKKCTFSECQDYGIIVEKLHQNKEGTEVGPVDILDSEVNILDESVVEGLKGAVMIRMKNMDAFSLSDADD